MSEPQSLRPKSAFQIVYILTFGMAIWDMLRLIFGSPIELQSRLAQIVEKAPEASGMINWMGLLPPIFAFLFAIHLVRIYITLEILEDGESIFEGFYTLWPTPARIIETILRVVILGLVASKVLLPNTYSDLWAYGLVFYSSLLAWSLVASIVQFFPKTVTAKPVLEQLELEAQSSLWVKVRRFNDRTFWLSSLVGCAAMYGLAALNSVPNGATVFLFIAGILFLTIDFIAFALSQHSVKGPDGTLSSQRAFVAIFHWYVNQYINDWDTYQR
jgi:hypothetical protein